MIGYVFTRLLLIIPTLIGIMAANFFITQMAPGGPVEQMIAQIQGLDGGAMDRLTHITQDGADHVSPGEFSHHQVHEQAKSIYQGSRGLSPQLIAEIEKLYGFDKPPLERFWQMICNYMTFSFGNSYFRGQSVVDLVWQKLPVSIGLGLWTTLAIYLVSIPLGIRKAVVHGTNFDLWSSLFIVIGYAIPGFLFAILLIVLFAGGSFWSCFPLRGLTSTGWEDFTRLEKIGDYCWHIALPLIAQVVTGFASLTLLTKNSFLEEMNKQYVTTARAKGLTERAVLINHIFRNAMLIVVAGIPGALVRILFTSSLLIEVIFSLDGLGLLGFESAVTRDYPVVFGTLYVFTLAGLLTHIVGDLAYTWVDPRIHFQKSQG